MLKMISFGLISFYQKIISPLKAPCCRFYPSCSEYALWQFQKNNFISALFLSFFRILRCNPYFRGGFDYPKIHRDRIKATKNVYTHSKLKFLYVPCNNKKEFYIIKIIF